MNGRALLTAVALAVAAPSGRPDEAAKAPPVAKADHVVVNVAGKTLAGWLIDPAAKDGSIYLGDDGAFEPLEVQPEGGRKMEVAEWRRGLR